MSYLLVGLAGQSLSADERRWLRRPEVAGVILFSRNCDSPAQVRALTNEIRLLDARLLVCMDQEGGRVQRLADPLTRLPALAELGRHYESDPGAGCRAAAAHAQLMALEVLSLGIDLSLAPVLDLDRGCAVVGDRAFHSDPRTVAELASAYVGGMRAAGMAACGKHFPGHGTVAEDTHVAVATDPRELESIRQTDLVPFSRLAAEGIAALMMAHVCYPRVCARPAGYAEQWIRDELRGRLGYRGVVISDDLGMRAAHEAGSLARRAADSLEAGCDLVLVCAPEDVAEAMDQSLPGAADQRPATELKAARFPDWGDLQHSQAYLDLRRAVEGCSG